MATVAAVVLSLAAIPFAGCATMLASAGTSNGRLAVVAAEDVWGFQLWQVHQLAGIESALRKAGAR
jgi:hypothetical protein